MVLDIDGKVVKDLKDGVNTIDMGDARYLRVTTVSADISFTEVTLIDSYYEEESDWFYKVEVMDDGRQFVDLSCSFPEDESFRIRTAATSDARSATCTINVDNIDKVEVTRMGVKLDLINGSNDVKFNPETESKIEIYAVDRPLYAVSHNGVVLAETYRYVLELKDGDVVDIVADYPDIDCTLTIEVTGNGASDFITEMDVNGRPEFGWNSTLTLKSGDEVRLKGNTTEYEVLEFTVNGVSQMFSNPVILFITEDTELKVTVRKYASFMMTVNVDDPDRVHIYRGYSYNGDELELQPGDNIVEITRNIPIISLVPADGCYINTLNISGLEYDVEELQRSPVMVGSLTDDEVLTVTTDVIVRDLKAMVYLNNLSASVDFFSLLRADNSAINVREGYNLIDFYERDNAFKFETGGPVEAELYVNNEKQSPEPGGFTYRPDLEDGDIVKVYFGTKASLYDVSFTYSEADVDKFMVTRDMFVESEGENFQALTGTLVAVGPTTDEEIFVKLNGEDLVADSDGIFAFTVFSDSNVEVTSATSGVENVTVDASEAGVVYNLQGVRIAMPFDELPAGIYILDGKPVKK